MRIAVDSGSSTGSAASPNAPPTAPDAAAASLWARCGGVRRALHVDGAERKLERARARRALGGMRRRMRRAGQGHAAAQRADRAADRIGQALGEARSFKAGDRAPQVLVFLRA